MYKYRKQLKKWDDRAKYIHVQTRVVGIALEYIPHASLASAAVQIMLRISTGQICT